MATACHFTPACYCAACGRWFEGKKRVRHLFNDAGVVLGPLCPACFALPPAQLPEPRADPGSKEHGYRLEQVAREPSIRHPVAPAVAAALATELGIPKKMQENQEKLSRNPNPPACHFVC
ncbi:hypothetical protein NW841_00300 [Synechococcus sp. H60.3]|uniref:hypothetical protein n=1 Tax=unclassified Synechococcus TaxID=2626047 RepID=UPI0039C010D1